MIAKVCVLAIRGRENSAPSRRRCRVSHGRQSASARRASAATDEALRLFGDLGNTVRTFQPYHVVEGRRAGARLQKFDPLAPKYFDLTGQLRACPGDDRESYVQHAGPGLNAGSFGEHC